MEKYKNKYPVAEQVEITDAGAEGKAIARINDKIVFVPFGAPGDIVDLQIIKKKKSYLEAKIVQFHKYSEKRTQPFCEHFGLCGGCKWQHLKYEDQLFYKQKEVENNLKRIGKIELPVMPPIIPSKKTTSYRNKLEFTFSCNRWLSDEEMQNNPDENNNGLGFHLPGRFDKVLDINHCYLQPEPSNAIRLEVKKYALKNHLEFLDVRTHKGFLRNLIIRNTTTDDLMVIVVFNDNDRLQIEKMLTHIQKNFPEITSLMYIVNTKFNDDISDQKVECFYGKDHIIEKMENLKFKIGPVSFFQTNSEQALELYKIARNFAGLTGHEIVYDLYTGTGTIGNFVAGQVKKVIGIEFVEDSIRNAKENALLNSITNAQFFVGDIAKILTDAFVNENSLPDIIITDPPRSGMHEDVVKQILKIAPSRIVYISCNSATQARDIALMKEQYFVDKLQTVDMFPHTHHLENVILLLKK